MSTTRSPSRAARRFDSLEQEAFLNLWRTYDRLRAEEDALFGRCDLTPQQYNALRLLRGARPDGLPTLSLAARLVSRAPDITRLLDKLEARGLVARRRLPENRRVVQVAITDAGLELLAELDSSVRACHRRQLGRDPRTFCSSAGLRPGSAAHRDRRRSVVSPAHRGVRAHGVLAHRHEHVCAVDPWQCAGTGAGQVALHHALSALRARWFGRLPAGGERVLDVSWSVWCRVRADGSPVRRDAPDWPRRERGQALGMAFRIATELVAALLVGGFIGWQLDRWLETRPVLFLLFLALGAAAGMRNVFKYAYRMNRLAQGLDDDGKAGPEGPERR
jgi:DNA-binding MarR family transcriptional regulator/F0F1-type ATP synthase assembly protein I